MNDVIVKFIVSEGIESQTNGFQQRQLIVNPVIVFHTPFIPTSLTLAVSMIICGISDGGKHRIGFTVKNTINQQIIFDSGIAELEVNKGLENFVISADLKNLGFENEGKYEISLSIDGEIYSDFFFVKKNADQ